MRTVKTASGATAVQIVYSMRRGSRQMEHIGSAHEDAEVELLKAAAISGCMRCKVRSISVWTSRWPRGFVAVGRCRSPPRGWSTCGMP